MTTLKRMGYRSNGAKWIFIKGRTKEFPPREEEEEEEERREGQDERRNEVEEEREEERREERESLLEEVMRRVDPLLPTDSRVIKAADLAASTAPSPPPSRHAQQPSQPIPNLTSLQNFITNSLAQLESSFTTQFHTLNQRVDNLESSLNFKLDTLISLVESQQPAPPPDPFKAKMKGIVIRDRS